MNFLKQLLTPGSKSDPFSINAIVDGMRRFDARIDREERVRQKALDKLRAAALADPDAELDETAADSHATKIEVLKEAREEFITEAAKAIDARMSDIKKELARLGQAKADAARKRDTEFIKVLQVFVEKTGGRVVELPRKGHGGMISIPATTEMDRTEVEAALKGLPEPGHPTPTATIKALDSIVAELHKLTMLTHYGSRRGLETLAGTSS